MKTKLTALVLCGLLAAPAALAAPSPHPGAGNGAPASGKSQSASETTQQASAPPKPHCAAGAAHAKQVTYVLRGKLSAYVAATAAQPGSVTIAVTGGNCISRALVGSVLTFVLSAQTRVVNGASIHDGDRGAVHVRGGKSLDAAALAKLTPRLVIDQIADDASAT